MRKQLHLLRIMTELQYTPIHHASKNCHLEVVKFLVNTCDKVDVRNNVYQTPIDLARQSGNRRIVKFLEGVMK